MSTRKQRRERAKTFLAKFKQGICINCGEKGPHFVPPGFGSGGMFICKKRIAMGEHCFYLRCSEQPVIKIRMIPPDDSAVEMILCDKDAKFAFANAAGCRIEVLAKYKDSE